MKTWSLALILAATAACRWHVSVELETHHLPGMLIDLPRGTHVDRLNSYAAGQRTIRSDKFDTVSAVLWRPGQYLDDQHFEMAIAASLLGLGSKTANVQRDVSVPLPNDLKGRSWNAEIDGQKVWSTYLACGGRHISLVTGGHTDLVRTLHRMTVASVRCRPDAAMEATLYDVPVVLDLPTGWEQIISKKNLATLVVTDGNHLIVVNTVATRSQPQAVRDMVTSIDLFGPLFGPAPRVVSQDHADVAFQGTDQGKPVTGWLTHLECRELGKMLQLISRSPGGLSEAEVGLSILRKARCRRGDEQPQTWPRSGAANFP